MRFSTSRVLIAALSLVAAACVSNGGRPGHDRVQAVAAAATRPATKVTGVALVANQAGASATIVDLASGATTTIAVGIGPHEAVVSPDGRTGIVTVYGTRADTGHELAVIDLATRALKRKIDLASYLRPHGAEFVGGSNTLLAVTSEATQRIALVDISAGRVVGEIGTRSPLSHLIALTRAGTRGYSADPRAGTLTEIDVANRTWLRALAVGPATEGVAVLPNGDEAWVGSNATGLVSVVDTRAWTIVDTIRGFGVPYRLAFAPNGRSALVSDPKSGDVHIVDVATRKLAGSIPTGGSPRGVLVSPDSRLALVATVPAESDNDSAPGALLVIDLDNRTIVARFAVGAAPDGVGYGVPTPGN